MSADELELIGRARDVAKHQTYAHIDPRFGGYGEAFDNWLQEVLEIERIEAYRSGYQDGWEEGGSTWE